ncbi:MAG: membrane protein insertion efficiency factor YidD [Gammaproteobacteria bacterium]|nr:membrane protein insertion efficiency factor YidD [Gammaproteobacteria bacterium]
MRWLMAGLIKVYRYTLSPFLGNNCRFYPTCSAYALEALERHGAWKGVLLAIRRVSHCHPWHPGGVDPVPERMEVTSKWKIKE